MNPDQAALVSDLKAASDSMLSAISVTQAVLASAQNKGDAPAAAVIQSALSSVQLAQAQVQALHDQLAAFGAVT